MQPAKHPISFLHPKRKTANIDGGWDRKEKKLLDAFSNLLPRLHRLPPKLELSEFATVWALDLTMAIKFAEFDVLLLDIGECPRHHHPSIKWR